MPTIDHVVTVHDAKTNLSRLMVEAERGQTIGIARGSGNEPTVVLTAAPARRRRQLGWMTGSAVPADFDTLGHDEIAALFEDTAA